MLSGLVIACSSPDTNGPAAQDPATSYWHLVLNTHAITMSTVAPYDTVRLSATPLTALGTPLVGAPAVTFTTTDSSVRVSPTGILTAHAVDSDVKVIATLTYHNVRQADTAFITVTSDMPSSPFTTLLLQLMPGDSTTLASSGIFGPFAKTITIETLDAAGDTIPHAAVALRVSDTLQMTIPPTVINGTADLQLQFGTAQPGNVTLYASATIYGVTKSDSLKITLTNPLLAAFLVSEHTSAGSHTPAFTVSPSAVTVGPTGEIFWENATTDSLDVVFDDPSAAFDDPIFQEGGGNSGPIGTTDFIQLFPIIARQFIIPGTYHWRSLRLGVSGTITVQ